MSNLVLSIFPGIDLLGRAFEEEGYCVVRGPDLLWGGDIRTFHPPAGKFDGVIGGPPCQRWSRLRHMVIRVHGEASLAPDLIPEYERVVAEAAPSWLLMENVPDAPAPTVAGYVVTSVMFNNRWLGEEQQRIRRFSLGTHSGRQLDISPDLTVFEHNDWSPAVLATGGYKPVAVRLDRQGKPKSPSNRRLHNAGYATRDYLTKAVRLQGLEDGFLGEAPFTVEGKVRLVCNGVPLPMGRAIARAVKRAMEVMP